MILNHGFVDHFIPPHGRLDESLDQLILLGGVSPPDALSVQMLVDTSGVTGFVEIASGGGQTLTAEPLTGQDDLALIP